MNKTGVTASCLKKTIVSRMPKDSKTIKCALSLTLVAILFVSIAFCSTHWLETDGRLKEPRFIRLGLWVVCFEGFRDYNRLYDTVFSSCWWNFEEEYYIISDILFPYFMIITQFFFSITFLSCICSLFAMFALTNTTSYDQGRLSRINFFLGIDLLIGAFCGLLACITFGLNGDRRDWMVNWEHNSLAWSYVCAVFGSLTMFPAGILYLIEVRRIYFRVLKNRHDPSSETNDSYAFNLDVRKPAHTDI